jgi:hypothetical protein
VEKQVIFFFAFDEHSLRHSKIRRTEKSIKPSDNPTFSQVFFFLFFERKTICSFAIHLSGELKVFLPFRFALFEFFGRSLIRNKSLIGFLQMES